MRRLHLIWGCKQNLLGKTAMRTTPGIPQYMHPVVALLTNGVEMDVLGIAYAEFSGAYREAIVAAYPRTEHFKEDIIQTFYDGIKHKPETTFGNVKADVLADKDAKFQRINFCSGIRRSQWKGSEISQEVAALHVANCSRTDPAYGDVIA